MAGFPKQGAAGDGAGNVSKEPLPMKKYLLVPLAALAFGSACGDSDPTIPTRSAMGPTGPNAHVAGTNAADDASYGIHTNIQPTITSASVDGSTVPLGTAVTITWSAPASVPRDYIMERYRYQLSSDAAGFTTLTFTSNDLRAVSYVTPTTLPAGTYTFGILGEAKGPKHDGKPGSDNHSSLRATVKFFVQAPPSGPQPNVITFKFPANFTKTYGDAAFILSDAAEIAEASSGLALSYASSTPSVCEIASGSSEEVNILAAGTCTIKASQAGDGDYVSATDVSASFTVDKASATISLSNLSQTYDGYAKSPTATTEPSGLTVAFQYSQSGQAVAAADVKNVGSYDVTATLANTNYQLVDNFANKNSISSVSGTFVIAPAPVMITLGNLNPTFDGTPKPVGVTISLANFTSYVVKYSSPTYPTSTTAPTNAGSYSVELALNDANYQLVDADNTVLTLQKVTATLEIAKATPIVVASGGTFPYDGFAHGGTGNATGVGGITLTPVSVSYSGTLNGGTSYGPSASAPVKAGAYTVTASYAASANYNGASDQATLTISRATPTITWSNPADIYFGTALSSAQLNAAATGVDGSTLAGAFAYTPAAGTTSLAVGQQPLSTTFTPTDGDNYTTATRLVTINVLAWTLKGFYQPVDMNLPDGTVVFNTVKAGSTVPFKFNVFAGPAGMNEQTNSGVVTGFRGIPIACVSAPEDVIEQFSTTGGTTLRYDGIARQFVQNWQTPKVVGACYKVVMSTADNSTLTAYFKLK